jgi:hypothetical protein
MWLPFDSMGFSIVGYVFLYGFTQNVCGIPASYHSYLPAYSLNVSR